MTLAAIVFDPPAGLRLPEPLSETVGGGGTTSCVPKSWPTMLEMNDPPEGVGGGGTTDGEDGFRLPLSMRRRSCVDSAEGGGATTDGAGSVSCAVRDVSRAGAETGGGTTALLIWTREGATSRLMLDGAGGTMLAFTAGAERNLSRWTCAAAGAITLGSSDGADWVRLRATLGAGAIMLGFNDGAAR